jgi:hypothetical protein
VTKRYRLRCGLTVEVRGKYMRHWAITSGEWMRRDLASLE